MAENLFEAQYEITKKSKIKKFYESNKILIFSFTSFLIISIICLIFYFESENGKRILLSDNYVQAKIYLEEGKKNEAIDLLKNEIYANDITYSTLSFFLILNNNLITDYSELSALFDHLLENNKFKEEEENLLIYKKALFVSNFVNEEDLLREIKPLLNSNTLWRPHALLLLGDYFVSKNEYLKAKDFYVQILSTKNLTQDFYERASFQLNIITNE